MQNTLAPKSFPLELFFSVWRVFAVSTNNLTYSQPVICVSFLTAQKQLPHFYDDVPSLSFIVASSLIFKMFTTILQKETTGQYMPEKKTSRYNYPLLFREMNGSSVRHKIIMRKSFLELETKILGIGNTTTLILPER